MRRCGFLPVFVYEHMHPLSCLWSPQEPLGKCKLQISAVSFSLIPSLIIHIMA
uniref:Uncharacterized protein n=1 Tax=Rhizophora mucronata TaxID=61149 RepID=A0A2P2R1I3_RHIMU